MSASTGFFGWVLIGLGLAIGTMASREGVQENPAPAWVTGALLILAGACHLVAYRNFRIVFLPDRLQFRSTYGREREIIYDQIVWHRFYAARGGSKVDVVGADETRLAFFRDRYDATPLLAVIEHHGREGLRPSRGDVAPGPSTDSMDEVSPHAGTDD